MSSHGSSASFLFAIVCFSSLLSEVLLVWFSETNKQQTGSSGQNGTYGNSSQKRILKWIVKISYSFCAAKPINYLVLVFDHNSLTFIPTAYMMWCKIRSEELRNTMAKLQKCYFISCFS